MGVLLFSCQVVFSSWQHHGLRQASLSLTISGSLPKFMPVESVMPSNHLILGHPLLLSPVFSGSFPVSQLVASSGQSIGASASASIFPKSIQGWFPLRLTGLISLLSMGLSRVFSSSMVQRHQFFGTLLSLLSSYHMCTWPLERP